MSLTVGKYTFSSWLRKGIGGGWRELEYTIVDLEPVEVFDPDKGWQKLPGVGETITWARALLALDGDTALDDTLGVALKVREDIDRVRRDKVLEGA